MEWSGRLTEGTEQLGEDRANAFERAKLCLLDWLGCAIAGMPEAREMTRSAGVGTGPADEALLFGIAGHLLDYDDTLPEALTHPSAVIWPALLAIRPNGGDLLRGFLVGVEAQSRWGRQHGVAIAKNSGHPTAALGVVSAALAVANISGLDESQTLRTLRMADALAAGSQSVFGTRGKSFQVGCAARIAVETTRLNWGSLPDTISGEDPLLAVGGMVDRITRDSLVRLSGIERDEEPAEAGHPVHRIVQKFHASCYATHGALDAFRDLAIDPAHISSVVVTIGDDFPAVAAAPLVESGLAAKFSMRACLALAACGYDTADPATFGPAPLADPRVRQFSARISCATSHEIPSGAGLIELRLLDGSNIRGYADPSSAAYGVDEQRARVEAKFGALAGPFAGEAAASDLSEMILGEIGECRSEDLSQMLEKCGFAVRSPEETKERTK